MSRPVLGTGHCRKEEEDRETLNETAHEKKRKMETSLSLSLTHGKTQICHSSLSCAQASFCTLGRLVVSPFYLLAGILNQINIAIGGESGQWTLGTGFWELLQITLLTVWGRFGPWFLTTMMAIDCITCATTGNIKGSIACKTPLYSFWLPIIQALTRVGAAIIIFVTDLVKTVILVLAYLFTGNIGQLIVVIADFLVSIFVNVIIPIIEAVFGFVLGFLCLCGVWNTLFSDVFTCTNFAWCGSKRRDVSAAFYEPLQTNVTFDYQRFAADWPLQTLYTWPPNDACNASMATYAPLAPYGLSQTQGEEASFCLAKILLFPEPVNLAQTTGTCRRVMHRLQERNVAFSALNNLEYAEVTQCVHDYGIAKTFKRSARSQVLEWLPDEVLSGDAGIMSTWVPLAANALHALNAQKQHARDVIYEQSVAHSSDYASNLAQVCVSLSRSPPQMTVSLAVLWP